jgi:hypothetical protein
MFSVRAHFRQEMGLPCCGLGCVDDDVEWYSSSGDPVRRYACLRGYGLIGYTIRDASNGTSFLRQLEHQAPKEPSIKPDSYDETK